MRIPTTLAALAGTVALTAAPLAIVPASAAGSTAYRLTHVTTYDGNRTVLRWNPCQTITYRINVAGLPNQAAKRSATHVTKASVARVARATGMSFSYRGRTNLVPNPNNIARQRGEIVIAFVRPAQTSYSLAGHTAGSGGWRSSYAPRPNGTFAVAITRGFVVIDQPQTRNWPNGVHRGGVTRANLMSHELGHALGLGHVHHRSQLMNDTLRPSTPKGFAAGDRAGLDRVGRRAGCIKANWSNTDQT